MRTARVMAIILVGITLITSFACGGSTGSQPTPTPTPTIDTHIIVPEGEIYTETYGESPIHTVNTKTDKGYTIRVFPSEDASPCDTVTLKIDVSEPEFGYTPIYIFKDLNVSDIPEDGLAFEFEFKDRIHTNIAYTGEPSCHYRDTVDLSAILTDDNGNPLSNKTITFQIGYQMIEAITDSAGKASASPIIYQEPSEFYYVETRFEGDMDYLPCYEMPFFEVLPAKSDISKLVGGEWVNYNINDERNDNIVTAIACDDHSKIWTVTYSYGTPFEIGEFDGNTWKTYIPGDELADIHDAYAIAIDNEGNKWLGTNAGVIRFNGEEWTRYTTEDGLATNATFLITPDNAGNIWCGFGDWTSQSSQTTHFGVSKFDGETWTTYNTDDGLASNEVWAIASDGEGNLWFGTSRGVSKFDGANWSTYTRCDGLAGNKITAIAVDSDGTKWFVTDKGLSRFDGINWTTYVPPEQGVRIIDVDIDSEGNVWFVAPAIFLTKFDGDTWVTYTPMEGLNYEYMVMSIAVDSKGNVWAGTDMGLYKFEPNP